MFCAIFEIAEISNLRSIEREAKPALMKNLLKCLGWGALLLMAYKIGSLAFLASPSNGKEATLNASTTTAVADLVIKGLHLTETSGDKLLWEIEADSARVYQQQQVARFRNIRLTLYEERAPVLKVQGDNGRLDMQGRDMVVKGNVIARSQAGLIFETNSLNWENKKRLLYTSDPVKITKVNIIIRGVGLVADVGLEKLKFNNGITTIIN